MPKTQDRLTKARVREEVISLRKKMKTYFSMTRDELEKEYKSTFLETPSYSDLQPRYSFAVEDLSREYMISGLIMSATYHLTNVLGLE